MDTGKYCFMIKDTLAALEQGAVETLICWDQLDADRLVVRCWGGGGGFRGEAQSWGWSGAGVGLSW